VRIDNKNNGKNMVKEVFRNPRNLLKAMKLASKEIRLSGDSQTNAKKAMPDTG
jgi:hypothetical protein